MNKDLIWIGGGVLAYLYITGGLDFLFGSSPLPAPSYTPTPTPILGYVPHLTPIVCPPGYHSVIGSDGNYACDPD